MALKNVDDLLWAAVKRSLDALELTHEDEGAATAALMIAINIDAHTDKIYAMRWLMPELLKYLTELGATPAARAAIKGRKTGGGENAPAPVSWLDQQRAALSDGCAKRP